MTLWGQAKRLSRNPFARIVTRLSEVDESEVFERRNQEGSETFAEWFFRSIGDEAPLFEENPYVDRIENDPILAICAGMTDDEPPELPKARKKPMGWEEYRKRQSEARRKKRNQTEGESMTAELNEIREQLRKALLVPEGDFPLLPSLEELIRERNDARSTQAENELEIVRLKKELQRSKSRESFLSKCMEIGDTPPCRNCGRIVLAGRCCEKPDVPEGQPVGVPLEEHDKVVEQLRSLQDLLSEYVVKSGRGKDDQDWVREMITKGFVPSISGTKARRERDEAQREAQQWHDLVSRLRTHLNIPHDATHQDAPRLAREALHKAQEQGAGWMREALIEDVIALRGLHESRCTPTDVCEARRPKEGPPLVNEYRKETPKCPPHRFALRQTTGKETCIDCFVEEDPGSPGLGVEQFANRAARRKSAKSRRKKV